MSKHKQITTVNPAFREWTRGVSFTLAMGKTQVAALVACHFSAQMPMHIGGQHKLLRNWVGAVGGLADRGLLVHVPTLESWSKGKWSAFNSSQQRAFGQVYRVTPAGAHVVGLLQEAGVYDELVTEFTAFDNQRTALRLRVTR